jgi:hypothetical protein
MASQSEDRGREATGAEPVDPFEVPARPVSAAPSAAGASAGEEGADDDAIWRSSYGYLLTQAYTAARPQRPDLSDEEFAILASQAIPTLSGHTGSMPAELLAYIDAVRPRPAPQPSQRS